MYVLSVLSVHGFGVCISMVWAYGVDGLGATP